MWHNGAARIGHITDGTSNTMMMAEAPLRRRATTGGIFWNQYTQGMYAIPFVNSSNYGGINRPFSATNPLVDYWGAGSFHAGGMHVLLADGASRFLSEHTSNFLIEGLVTVAGGELPGEF